MRTDIICIIDESGSMAHLKDDTIGGFNQFLKDQKAVPGECYITLCKFNTPFQFPNCIRKDIQQFNELTSEDYNPNNGTALLDAIGTSIDKLGEVYKNLPQNEQPEKVICLIITDGQENSSKEYKYEQIKELITRQTDEWKWEFMFQGTTLDQLDYAKGMGIVKSCLYAASGEGIQDSYRGFSKYSSNVRTGN